MVLTGRHWQKNLDPIQYVIYDFKTNRQTSEVFQKLWVRVLEVYHDLKVLNGHGNRSNLDVKPSFWGEIMVPKSVPYIRAVFSIWLHLQMHTTERTLQ
jgi:hypothetical protein